MADGDELGPLVQIGGIVCNSGVPDAAGVEWICEEFEGWGSPASTLEVTQRSGDHGGWDGDAWLKPRIMTLKGLLAAPTASAARDAESRLFQALPVGSSTLTITEAGLARTCTVRRQDDVLAQAVSPREVEWSAQVVAPDPRKYAAQQSTSTGLPSSTGGLVAPIKAPLKSVATVVSGVLSVFNAGDFPTRPTFTIAGPVVNPQIVHVASQRTLAWSLSLGVGEWIDVDTARRTALLNGQVSRAGAMTSRGWFDLDPGAADIGFAAADYTASTLTVSWRSAWM